jgi:uncharacterized protein HemY
LKQVPTDQWALAFEAAQQLADFGSASDAVPLVAAVLAHKSMPREVRTVWLRQAAKIAAQAGDRERAAAWTDEAEELSR